MKLNRSQIENIISKARSENSQKRVNLTNVNLSGLDLSNMNLSFIDFKGSNLSNCNISNTSLNGCNLYKVNLSGSSLINSSLTIYEREKTEKEKKEYLANQNENLDLFIGFVDIDDPVEEICNLQYTNLNNANLKKANLNQSNLSHSTIINSNLENSSLESVDLSNSELTNTKLDGAILFNAFFFETNLKGASLKNTKIHKNTLNNIPISHKQMGELIIESTDEEIENAKHKYELEQEQRNFYMNGFDYDKDNDQQDPNFW